MSVTLKQGEGSIRPRGKESRVLKSASRRGLTRVMTPPVT